MSKLGLSILVSILMLVGCGNKSEEKEVATLEDNVWVSEACEDIVQIDNNSVVHIVGSDKKTYQFTDDNQIYVGSNVYSDENCTEFTGRYAPEQLYGGSFNYYDMGEIDTNDQYIKHGLRISLSEGPIKIDDIKNGINKDAFYAITANRVCFSKSIFTGVPYVYETTVDSNGNVISSTHLGFFIDSFTDRTDEIDFKDCLVKE